MRQSYLKNAALLTGSDIVLRLAGMGLRIYLANALGGEGMGLYQMVLAVYSLFVTLATAGVSAASTRLMAEELTGPPARARGMLARLCAAALGLGCAALAGQWLLAPLAARWWLGDLRAAAALRAAAFGMPFMAVSAVLRGFFVARQRVGPNVASQLAEQAFRIGVMAAALELTAGRDIGVRCAVVLGATAASEALSAVLMAGFCKREAPRAFGHDRAQAPLHAGRRLWEILWPVGGGRCVASALHTAENMLVPACLTVYLGRRAAAVAQYGVLKGMALPLVHFPFGLLGSLGVLLMPEITRAHIRANRSRLTSLLRRMLRLTVYFSAFVGMVFWVWGQPLGLVLYGSREAGAISYAVAYYAAPELLFTVQPGSFYPAPKVTSAVIRLTLHDTPPVQPANGDERGLFRLIRAAFSQRRKTAANAVAAGLGLPKPRVTAALQAAGLDARLRPEQLTLADYCALQAALCG